MANSVFDHASGPLGTPSKEAKDFALKAVNNILPWIKSQYQLASIAPGFTPGDLYNFHLRGDYYLGLTKPNFRLDSIGLSNPPGGVPRLVHIAQRTGYEQAMASSVDTIAAISGFRRNTALFPFPSQYGIRFAEGPVPPVEAEHFFTREVASGSSLTEFLLPELGTMFYRLLPYVEDFQSQVSKYLTEESLTFIKSSKMLANGPDDIHRAIRIDQDHIDDTMAFLDGNGYNPAQVGNASPNFVTMGTPGTANYQEFSCLLPLHYAIQTHHEMMDLIYPNQEVATHTELNGRLRSLFLSAIEACIQLTTNGRIGYTSVAGGIRYISKRTARQGGGSLNSSEITKAFKAFFDSYFLQLNPKFPVGSVVQINTSENSAGGRSPFLAAMVKLVPETAAELVAHTRGNPYFRITAIETRKKRNKPIVTHYALMSVDEFNTPLPGPRGVPIQSEIVAAGGLIETYKGNYEDYIGFTSFGDGGYFPGTYDIGNIIGRCLLSTSYDISTAANYFNSERDMRVLTKGQPPGHFEPLNEAVLAATIRGRRGHVNTAKKGVIDNYAELRADLMALYLASMYDSIKGSYRDQFVAFYTGDYEMNQLSYYTNAISNYISSQVRPEDSQREPVLVGARLTTRVPEIAIAAGAPRGFTFTRSADPEVVYYQIDSPLLREAYQNLNLRFYTWYTNLAEGLDRGPRNLTPGGNESGQVFAGRLKSKKDDKSLFKPVKPTKLILKQMWPLLTQRAQSAVESGEVPAHLMLREIADSVRTQRQATSQAIPLIPISTSFIDFGSLLRDPAQYSLPPETSSSDILSFMSYIESTFFNDYQLLARLASNIETVRSQNYSQDQLISAFKKTYATFRNTKALNKYSFPASAELVRILRTLATVPPAQRAAIAAEADITSTMTPPAPIEQQAVGPPLPEPIRRVP